MVTYGDYFSRKTLHTCGVSPSEILFNKDENPYTGMERTENIRLRMSEIYQNLYRGYAEKNPSAVKEDFDGLGVERRIVASFYDSGILSNAERDYFQTQTLQDVTEREKICVEEASLSSASTQTQKVEAPIKTPLVRKM